jgi:hypothetical protein
LFNVEQQIKDFTAFKFADDAIIGMWAEKYRAPGFLTG